MKFLQQHYSIPAFDEGATPAFETGADIKSNKYKVYPTAVLSSKLNPHFPRTWIPDVQNPDAAICSTEFMQFVPLEPQHRAFIAGMITSEPFQSGIMIRVTGSTGSRQRAQPKQVAAMDVILPKSELRAVYNWLKEYSSWISIRQFNSHGWFARNWCNFSDFKARSFRIQGTYSNMTALMIKLTFFIIILLILSLVFEGLHMIHLKRFEIAILQEKRVVPFWKDLMASFLINILKK